MSSGVMRDSKGRYIKGSQASPSTQFKNGHIVPKKWREATSISTKKRLREFGNPILKIKKEDRWNWKGGISINDIRKYRKLCKCNSKGKLKFDIKDIQKVYEENIKKHGCLSCEYCLIKIPFGYDTIDHRIPFSRGGDNTIDNICIACERCNLIKSIKTDKEYMEILYEQNRR